MEASQLRKTSGVKIPLQSENSTPRIQMRQIQMWTCICKEAELPFLYHAFGYNACTANPDEWGHIRTSTHALYTRERSSRPEVVNSASTGSLLYMQCTLCYRIQSSLSLCYTTVQLWSCNWNLIEVRDMCRLSVHSHAPEIPDTASSDRSL